MKGPDGFVQAYNAQIAVEGVCQLIVGHAVTQALSRGGTVSAYGAAGSLIALLLWIYYSAQIFFFGAVFTRQFALRFSRPHAHPHAAGREIHGEKHPTEHPEQDAPHPANRP